jgi:glycine/D-amino acid oxidase-like deaminating enzyme/nitrite reductase/ring-hydroxylating ferredoxin subunit
VQFSRISIMPSNVQSERSVSLWMPVPELPGMPVAADGTADLVVVGGGMAGLSVAYEAACRGRKVTVIDRGPIASGMTARTTAHLASQLDDRYYEFINLRGEDEARLLYQSLAASIDRIEAIVRDEKIDCDFARCDGYLFLGDNDKIDILEKEIAACHKIGFAGVRWEERAPFPGYDTGKCLVYPGQARFHPLKYLEGLARAILAKGGVFHPYSAVDALTQARNGGEVVVAMRSGEKITARDVVSATNAPIAGRLTLQAKMAPYRSYVVAFELPKGALTDALYWDTLDAYHYARLQPGGTTDTLIVGGQDHKTGEADNAEARFMALEAWTRMRVPQIGAVTHRWSGQVLEPVDFAGYVGVDPDNDHIYFVTGDSGQGITNGAVAGLLIPVLCDGGDHPWRKLYDPARVSLNAAGTFIEENSTAVKSMVEHLGGPLLESEEKLGPGEGGLVRSGVNIVAAFRDEQGNMHRVSSKCSHVWCTVHFNSFERCWDCPCHGSHFDIDGAELCAPATAPLEKVNK